MTSLSIRDKIYSILNNGDEKVKITGKKTIDVEMEVDQKELGRILMGLALEKIGVDDPGCDYSTDDRYGVYMGLNGFLGYWMDAAIMIDAANILIYGQALKAS